MVDKLIKWDIYEISSESSKLEGVMLRGRIRKFATLNNMNLLVENASDKENVVRYAILSGDDNSRVSNKIKEMIKDSKTKIITKGVINPVLSKLKVNIDERYKI